MRHGKETRKMQALLFCCYGPLTLEDCGQPLFCLHNIPSRFVHYFRTWLSIPLHLFLSRFDHQELRTADSNT